MIFPITFAVVGISVIPLQFPHLVRSPFFDSFAVSPLFQSVGTFSSIHTFLIIFCIFTVVVSMFACRSSAVILSTPCAFPFLALWAQFLLLNKLVAFHLCRALLCQCSLHLPALMVQVYWELQWSALSIVHSLHLPLLGVFHPYLWCCQLASAFPYRWFLWCHILLHIAIICRRLCITC